ncbi:hypothetical protein BPOR_1167g00030 [Botrytis porri]|uniref:Uncharacterized protein n=1 Tax=Botrytis porri TaxID=87229 RepID=A0A4Z1K5J1_9HELO|nr:hypothetical protein BPOR_1167g00030 [Botrytis porri]
MLDRELQNAFYLFGVKHLAHIQIINDSVDVSLRPKVKARPGAGAQSGKYMRVPNTFDEEDEDTPLNRANWWEEFGLRSESARV